MEQRILVPCALSLNGFLQPCQEASLHENYVRTEGLEEIIHVSGVFQAVYPNHSGEHIYYIWSSEGKSLKRSDLVPTQFILPSFKPVYTEVL